MTPTLTWAAAGDGEKKAAHANTTGIQMDENTKRVINLNELLEKIVENAIEVVGALRAWRKPLRFVDSPAPV